MKYATNMTDQLLAELRNTWENPLENFIEYSITSVDPKAEQEKIDAMQPEEREAYLAIPDDMRVQLKPEFQGLVNSISRATDLVYEIANGVPNGHNKELAIGLVKKVCELLADQCAPKEKE